MRLDKYLSKTGFGSRKEVKMLLKGNIVKINDVVVKDGSKHVDIDKDVVTVLGETITYKEYVYFMLNKPSGVVSATVDNYDKTVVELLNDEDSIYDVHPVGRLDKDTEGLLILTNDGQFTHNLLSPNKKIPKTYYARLRDNISSDLIEVFEEGITLDDGYKTKPGILKIVDDREVELTIYEGKFHQVKRMFKAVDNEVIYLKRIKMGEVPLDANLELGEYRELTQDELEILNP